MDSSCSYTCSLTGTVAAFNESRQIVVWPSLR